MTNIRVNRLHSAKVSRRRQDRAAEQHEALAIYKRACQSLELEVEERPRFAHWHIRTDGRSLICHCQRFGLSVREAFENLYRGTALSCDNLSLTRLLVFNLYTAIAGVGAPLRQLTSPALTTPARSWRLGPACDHLRSGSSRTASAATGAASYSNIIRCARSAGRAPSAAPASATSPSPNLSPKHTLALAS
jgi:hypothetical protein